MLRRAELPRARRWLAAASKAPHCLQLHRRRPASLCVFTKTPSHLRPLMANKLERQTLVDNHVPPPACSLLSIVTFGVPHTLHPHNHSLCSAVDQPLLVTEAAGFQQLLPNSDPCHHKRNQQQQRQQHGSFAPLDAYLREYALGDNSKCRFRHSIHLSQRNRHPKPAGMHAKDENFQDQRKLVLFALKEELPNLLAKHPRATMALCSPSGVSAWDAIHNVTIPSKQALEVTLKLLRSMFSLLYGDSSECIVSWVQISAPNLIDARLRITGVDKFTKKKFEFDGYLYTELDGDGLIQAFHLDSVYPRSTGTASYACA